MKKAFAVSLSAIALAFTSSAFAEHHKSESEESLPVPYEVVFSTAMNDPNVMVYYGDKLYREGNYKGALKWLLEAAQYNHPAAIKNAKHLIVNGLGVEDNRESVVAFLSYYAAPRGDEPADVFAQLYLADYYRGDTCVWSGNNDKEACLDNGSSTSEPLAASDMRESYFYYESAAEQGAARAQYTAGMMNILGVGAPRNVPLGIKWLAPLAEDGNAKAAFIIGSIYQDGYWMTQDRAEASKWLSIAAQTQHPGAMLLLAKNAEAGVLDGDSKSRAETAVKYYQSVLSGVLANVEEKSEAAYRLGLLYASNPHVKNADLASKFMQRAVNYVRGEHRPNVYAVKAKKWQGEQVESSDLALAVKHYEAAIKMLETLPLQLQQQNGSLYERIANAYGRGQEDNLQRDERMFSYYMKARHVLSAKTAVPNVDLTQYKGYSAFNF